MIENPAAWDERGSWTKSEETGFGPPLAMGFNLSTQPWLSAQNRIINRTCLTMLLKQYDLRSHLDLLHRYQLLADGPFTSRLCQALFSPDLGLSEYYIGQKRFGPSGLQLGYRDTWPPASAELRLALMGLLTDSYFPTGYAEKASLFREELPGGLSFAIREMSEDEFQRCIDPFSVFALDFLHLQYRAPPPLDVVISATSMLKYDAIFRLLLRVQRMLFATKSLVNDTRALRLCSQRLSRKCDWEPSFRPKGRSKSTYWLKLSLLSRHFVSCISNYFFNGVSNHWSRLIRRLASINKDLVNQDGGFVEGIYALRDFHNQVLDRIMLTLFLRKRQIEVMKLLEEIFETILRFANQKMHDATLEAEAGLNELYESLYKKITIFVRSCRALSEKSRPGGARSDGHGVSTDENTVGQLLLSLNMNDFYER